MRLIIRDINIIEHLGNNNATSESVSREFCRELSYDLLNFSIFFSMDNFPTKFVSLYNSPQKREKNWQF
jgi:hypothetical protein